MNSTIRHIEYDYHAGSATCLIMYKDGSCSVGYAYCHPDDMDVKSNYTGCHIAFVRANINRVTQERDALKNQLKSLNDFYCVINQSKHYNADGYEATMLRRKISQVQAQLDDTREELAEIKKGLRDYMATKAKFAERYREKQKAKNS